MPALHSLRSENGFDSAHTSRKPRKSVPPQLGIFLLVRAFSPALCLEFATMTSPTHSKTQACLQRGIFDGLKSFRELETRIRALAKPPERGAAFEVFVEAYLTTPFAGVKLVFSTYQSAPAAAAGMKRGDTFDLALFDEAHKTAGRESVRRFARRSAGIFSRSLSCKAWRASQCGRGARAADG